MGETYRNSLIEKNDLVALWVTGPKRPGIYEFGWATSDGPYQWMGFDREYAIDHARAARPTPGFDYAAVRLFPDRYVPRDEIKADATLQRCEQIRIPRMTNPSFLTPNETQALAKLIAKRLPKARLKDAHWDKFLSSTTQASGADVVEAPSRSTPRPAR